MCSHTHNTRQDKCAAIVVLCCTEREHANGQGEAIVCLKPPVYEEILDYIYQVQCNSSCVCQYAHAGMCVFCMLIHGCMPLCVRVPVYICARMCACAYAKLKCAGACLYMWLCACMHLLFSVHEGRRVKKSEGAYQVIHTIKSLIQQLELQMWGARMQF